MGSGAYDRVIDIQSRQVIDDGQSTLDSGDWQNEHTGLPARFKPGVGHERFQNAENSAAAPAVFYTRYSPDIWPIDERHAILDAGSRWHITSARWSGRTNDEIEIAVVRKGL